MPSVAIVADTGCDLPPTLVEQYAIWQVPLIARFGTYELIDGPAARSEFWQKYDISQPPQTSGPSVGAWIDMYRSALEQVDEVIAITLTSKHSGTYNSALVAASEFSGRVHVFDSWSLSLGEGLLTLKAAQLAATGEKASTILNALENWRLHLHIFILLDTLEAVQRGGRLAPLMAVIKRMSGVLKIKPVLTLREGDLHFEGAVRSLKRGLNRLSNTVAGQHLEAVAVAHTRAPEIADELANQIAQASDYQREAIILAEAGPALAVHAGPRAFGFAYIPVTS